MDGREDYLANLSKARLGDAKAMYNVGICYQSGIGVEIDIDRSIEWYEMSAEHGFDEALILLEGILVVVKDLFCSLILIIVVL